MLIYLYNSIINYIFYFQRCELPSYEDDESFDDDNPTVVVLNEGDLTSEEALKDKLAKERGRILLNHSEFYL